MDDDNDEVEGDGNVTNDQIVMMKRKKRTPEIELE